MKRLSRFAVVIAIALLAQASWGQSAVHGTGTTNTIAVWTNGTTIGNSLLTQSGSSVNVNGSVTATSFTGDGTSVSNVNAAKLGSILPSGFAQLAATNNPFSGNVSVAGTLSGSTISSGNGGFYFGDTQILTILPGLFNLYVGQAAGQGAGTSNTGSQNTATGYQTLFLNTSGGSNTANGTNALYSNTTGDDNTAIGNHALSNNTTGVVNTATGNNALTSNTTGGANTAAGDGALFSNSTGSNNVAIGRLSLSGLGSGGNNTALGTAAGGNFAGSESNNVDISNPGVAGESGIIRIGTAGTHTATYVAGITGVTTGSSSTSTVLVDANGQLGTIASSRRYKEDIHDMGSASAGLLSLRPVTFRYKKAYADGSKPIQYGLIAEEVAQVYPDLVVRGKDGQVETVQYYKLDAMLLNEVQKLVKLHTDDQDEIAKLRSEVAAQRTAMKQLLNNVRAIEAKLGEGRQVRTNVRFPDQN